MKFPANMTEDQVVEIIQKVVSALANKFRFGYHSSDDMKQQGALFAVEAMTKGGYDESRPLENYLYIYVRNQFINYKRNNYVRREPPCNNCVFFDPKCKKSINKCAAFEDTSECKKLMDWKNRNEAKRSLMRPLDVSILPDEAIQHETTLSDAIDFSELEKTIRDGLPVDLQSDYLRMRAEISIPKARRQKVREAVLQIYRDRGLDHEETN